MTGSIVAVAGATGTVGAPLVEALGKRGHAVVPIARSTGVDLMTGAGLDRALEGVGVVVDVSNIVTSTRRAAIEFFRQVTGNLLAAGSRSGVGHHIALSIVGTDKIDYGYYAGKRVQEHMVMAADLPYTIVRATQFHEFASQMLARMQWGPAVFIPQFLCSPVCAVEVAEYLAKVVEDGPPAAGGKERPAEIAGPANMSLFDMVRALQRRLGDHHLPVSVPVPGRAGRLMRTGGLLPDRSECHRGSMTFEAWLARSVPAGGA